MHEHHLDAHEHASGQVSDPVCGMTVDVAGATAVGLSADHEGRTYYFCGRGCKLEFADDPAHYLDPAYQPSMEG